jgi:putative tryptophan/tyrosine transport system substrate-binding protein
MRRREFITLLGGAAAWPVAASAQGPDRLRRIGVLMAQAESVEESQARKAAFEQALSQLEWKLGRTLAIDYRWAVNNPERAQAAAAELLGLAPDLVVAVGTPAARAAHRSTRTIPIVFVAVSEPVSQGIVASLAHPGGNATGFSFLESTLGAKWLELLKEIAPRVSRVAVISHQAAPQTTLFLRSVEAAGPQFAVQAVAAPVRGLEDFEAVITRLAGEPITGLIIPPDPFTTEHHKLVLELANRHRLPTIAAFRVFPANGGLASYGVSVPDLLRQAAGYVDRILKGDRPSNLPVQQPTKFELSINLKTAKALGVEMPPTVLARADEVIE